MKKTKMLKKNYEFKTVFDKGEFYGGKVISAFIRPNGLKTEDLLGLAINTKIGHAVTRNHIKRLLRECYKKFEDSIKPGYTMVFIWKKKAKTEQATYSQIELDMKKILIKANILN